MHSDILSTRTDLSRLKMKIETRKVHTEESMHPTGKPAVCWDLIIAKTADENQYYT